MPLSATKKLVLCSILIYTVLVAALIAEVFVKTGHFVYPLDDAYIHLALAEQLAHGQYGTNPGEFSSPSSSLLWPFLLIPFAGTRLHTFVPLIFQRTHPQYILDVAGLGSFEAAQHPFKEASWMSESVQEHHIQLAALYPQLYHIPASWTPLAQMCEDRPPAATVLKDCVVFFSTAPEYTAAIRSDLDRFASMLPAGVVVEPPDSRGLD